jgi:C_GCAxxG_C_C family probable redox protein
MVDYAALKKKVDELAEREWDEAGIKARISKMVKEGIPRKKLEPEYMLSHKEEILDRVQQRGEEYNFIFKNCARGTAMALLEEFGLGNMDVIKALAAFPGIAGSGNMCGGITGSLITFGLYFGGEDPLDMSIMADPKRNPILIAHKFMEAFKDTLGRIYCTDIIETVTLGHRLNPGESDAAMAAFASEKGFEKCGLVPGTGARLAAGFIIDSMK